MQTFDCPFLISRALKRMKMGHKVAEFVVIKHFSTFLRLGGGCLLKVFSSHHINLICTRQVFCFQTLAKRQKTFFMMTHSSWEEEWAGGGEAHYQMARSIHQVVVSHSVWPDWAINWTLCNFLKPLATINLPKSPTFLCNFCKDVKINYFSSEVIFRQLL